MFPPRKILFPVDFSERSLAVIPTAEAFARKFDAELTLMHVKNPAAVYDPAMKPETRLNDFAACLAFQGLQVKTTLSCGDPADAIVRYAHDTKSDLILMPTHGYGPFRRFLLGSVTLKVLHDAWCPVWTDAHCDELDAKPAARIRNIVCAVDLTTKGHPALQFAWQLAKAAGAKMTIVHAVPLLTSYGAEYVAADWQEEIAAAAEKQIECLQRSEGTNAPVEIVLGEVATAVRGAAEEDKADVVVIGRSVEDRGLGRLRTHAYSIIRQSHCPVISV